MSPGAVPTCQGVSLQPAMTVVLRASPSGPGKATRFLGSIDGDSVGDDELRLGRDAVTWHTQAARARLSRTSARVDVSWRAQSAASAAPAQQLSAVEGVVHRLGAPAPALWLSIRPEAPSSLVLGS